MTLLFCEGGIVVAKCLSMYDKMSWEKKYDPSGKQGHAQGPRKTKIDNYPIVNSTFKYCTLPVVN